MTAAAADPAAAPAADAAAPPPRKRSKLPLLFGLLLAVAGGAGGFLAVRAGLLGGGGEGEAAAHEAPAEEEHLPEIAPAAFVALPPLTVNVGPSRFLRFSAQVEVDPAHLEEVTALSPRIVDVLNGYLRALEPRDLDAPAALIAIRSQLLRRVQAVAGGDRARDLLVQEFVVN